VSQNAGPGRGALEAEQVGEPSAASTAPWSIQDRIQFEEADRQFPGIKHKCADMLIEVESSQVCGLYAGWARRRGLASGCRCGQVWPKSYCWRRNPCAAETIQITRRLGCPLGASAPPLLQGAKSSELLLGDPSRPPRAVGQRHRHRGSSRMTTTGVRARPMPGTDVTLKPRLAQLALTFPA